MSGYEEFKDDTVSSSDLAALATFADDLNDAETEVARIEEKLKAARAKVTDLAERVIPELMDSLGLKTFTTTSGFRIEVRKTIRASIPVANRERAMKWLDDHGHSGLIKRLIMVSFDRDQEEEAHKLRENLQGQFENVKEDQNVHPSTLRAFIAEQLANGAEIPLELFGAWEQRTAKITAVE